MNDPDEFLKSLAPTSDTDQALAAYRSLAGMAGMFYRALLADELEESVAVELTCELVRCMIGDHKAAS